MGLEVLLVGVRFAGSPCLAPRSYGTHRIRLFARKGAAFYAEYNLKLFFFLFFRRFRLYVANDLDVLLANFLAARLHRRPLIYDSHEYFTELPELIGRRFVRRVWLGIERLILPKIRYAYTVCRSIAQEYHRLYGIEMSVVRNLPLCQRRQPSAPLLRSFPLSGKKKLILYQGALNVGRGIEEMIKAMHHLPQALFVIVGEGEISGELRKLVHTEKLQESVVFTGKIPFDQLAFYTRKADVGVVLQKDMGLSYRFVLPNRLFDYIQAEIPVLASDLPEMRNILEQFRVGVLLSGLSPETIAEKLKTMLSDTEKRRFWKENLKLAASELCWEKEEKRLHQVYKQALQEKKQG